MTRLLRQSLPIIATAAFFIATFLLAPAFGVDSLRAFYGTFLVAVVGLVALAVLGPWLLGRQADNGRLDRVGSTIGCGIVLAMGVIVAAGVVWASWLQWGPSK